MISSLEKNETYEEQKIATSVIVEEDTNETRAFLDFLSHYIEHKEIKDEAAVDDALFWDDIDLYIFIPKDFYDRILNEEEAFTLKAAPDSLEATSLISTINSYLNSVKENVRLELCSKDNALSYTKELFVKDDYVRVDLVQASKNGALRGMYDVGVYVIGALTLLIVGLVSFEIRTTDINRRLRISAYSTSKRNIMLGLCYLLFSIFFVGVITLLGIAIFPEQITARIGIYILNACLFSITMVFMALLLSSLFKSGMAYSCVANVIPLVSAFLCGSFVNLELMPEFTKAIGHIFPNIYIVLANSYIQTATEFSFGHYLSIVWPCFLFIAVFILGSILITNHMAKSEN